MKKTIKKVFIILGILFVVIIIIAAVSPSKKTTTGNTESANTQAPAKTAETESIIKISAQDLYQAYKDNAVAADQKYKDKQVEVTGTIYDFGTDVFGHPYFTFGMLETQAVFGQNAASQLANLQKGQAVTVQCTVSGAPLTYPILENCQLK